VSLHGHAMSRLLNRSARIFSALNVDSLRRRERERERLQITTNGLIRRIN